MPQPTRSDVDILRVVEFLIRVDEPIDREYVEQLILLGWVVPANETAAGYELTEIGRHRALP